MTQLAGTTNEDSLNLAANLSVGGTMGVGGAATFSAGVTFAGTVTNSGGGLMPGTLFGGAGTVTGMASGFVAFNASVAGFAVQLPAPVKGAKFEVINQIVAASGNNTLVIPAGGTIYQGASTGTVLTFGTSGQTATLLGISSTQYRVMSSTGSPVLS